MKKCCLATMFILLIAVAASYSQDPGARDGIEGSWLLTGSTTPAEKKIPSELNEQLMGELTISKDGVYEQRAAGMKVESGKCKVDAAKKPAWIDLEPAEGPNKGKNPLLRLFGFQ